MRIWLITGNLTIKWKTLNVLTIKVVSVIRSSQDWGFFIVLNGCVARNLKVGWKLVACQMLDCFLTCSRIATEIKQCSVQFIFKFLPDSSPSSLFAYSSCRFWHASWHPYIGYLGQMQMLIFLFWYRTRCNFDTVQISKFQLTLFLSPLFWKCFKSSTLPFTTRSWGKWNLL